MGIGSSLEQLHFGISDFLVEKLFRIKAFLEEILF